MQKPFISCQNLCYSYTDENGEKNKILKNISLEIQKGSFVAILGHNGSGKSTLAKLLNMIFIPESGEIIVDGINLTSPDLTEEQLYEVRRKIGMVFQNPDNQIVATVVEEDVAFGPENLGIPSNEIRKRVDDALSLLGMSEYSRHSPHRLSGGQKQRIAVAGIIAMMPDCIVFDEATAMLDPSGRAEVMEMIKMLNKERGITVIHITHNMDEALAADRIIVINDGEIALDDTPKVVFSNVAKLHEIGLDVPQANELLYELNLHGFNFSLQIDEMQQVANLIANCYNLCKGGLQ